MSASHPQTPEQDPFAGFKPRPLKAPEEPQWPSNPAEQWADELVYQHPILSRRRFLAGIGAVGAGVVLGIRANRDDSVPATDEVEPGYEPSAGEELFNPIVKIRPRVEDFGDIEVSEAEQSTAERLRRAAPVFTLVHTVRAGETVSELARRYYAPRSTDSADVDEAFIAGITGLGAANHLDDEGSINEGQQLYVPISEPVSVELDGRTVADIAAEWGFSQTAVEAVNADPEQTVPLDNVLYLPVQRMPDLAEDEEVYVVGRQENGDPTTYYSIAQARGTGLSTLIGRNKPDPARLESGHVLIASAPEADEPTPTVPTTPPSVPSDPASPEVPREPDDGVTPEELISTRTWSGEIVRTHENDELEQDITIERIEDITLSREGYENWLSSIDTETFVEVFERAKTLHPAGELSSPEYFIIHHTAQGVEAGVTGMERLTSSMVNNGLSVQWAINQENETYQLVTNPKLACNHAHGINPRSTGVELVTDSTRAQGSVTTEQLASAIYLAYYVVTEVYGKDPTGDLKGVVVGHREINDRLDVGSAGKPDFFEESMDEFRGKLSAFAEAMAA